MLARLWLAVAAALTPVLALAQPAGGQVDPADQTGTGFAWLWILAVAAILFVLFRMFFARRRGGPPLPPGRAP
jgi:hypothetical protein